MRSLLILMLTICSLGVAANSVSCTTAQGERLTINGDRGELYVEGQSYDFDASKYDGNTLFQAVSGGPVKAFTFNKSAKKLRFLKKGWTSRDNINCQ